RSVVDASEHRSFRWQSCFFHLSLSRDLDLGSVESPERKAAKVLAIGAGQVLEDRDANVFAKPKSGYLIRPIVNARPVPSHRNVERELVDFVSNRRGIINARHERQTVGSRFDAAGQEHRPIETGL